MNKRKVQPASIPVDEWQAVSPQTEAIDDLVTTARANPGEWFTLEGHSRESDIARVYRSVSKQTVVVRRISDRATAPRQTHLYVKWINDDN